MEQRGPPVAFTRCHQGLGKPFLLAASPVFPGPYDGGSSGRVRQGSGATLPRQARPIAILSNCLPIDLSKAFNTLPRQPILWSLELLGLDPQVVRFGVAPRILSSVPLKLISPWVCRSSPQQGPLKGDPASVLAMTALCQLFGQALSPWAKVRTYVDSWSWTGSVRNLHQPMLQALGHFTQALRLAVDWQKSYFFATTDSARKWWKTTGHALVPGTACTPLVAQVKELGCHLQFTKRRILGHLPCQFSIANAKLHQLFHVESPLEDKCLAVQNNIFPQAFFGAIAMAPGLHRMQVLHSNAARAVVGRHHTLSLVATFAALPTVDDPEVFLIWSQLRQLRRAFRCNRLESAPVGQVHAGPGNVTIQVQHTSSRDVATARARPVQVQAACLHRIGLSRLGTPGL